MRLVIVTLGALLLLAALPPSAPAAGATYERYQVTVDGETAYGDLAYPSVGTPTTLLVFGHGCCGHFNQSGTVIPIASAYGAVAVAMEYRGSGGWDVMKGHEDLIAATLDLKARFPTITRTILWGASMGGETTGMAVAERPDLFDYWVDEFGVTNLVEEFGTLGLYPCACADSWMIQETGGTPATAPQAYLDRSPALHTDQMVGIRHAYISHGLGDPIVPYTMSRETFAGLVAHGIPASFYTVVSGCCGAQGPWTPLGFTGVPYCTGATGTYTCVPPSACEALPTGGYACMPGPAAHDGRGGGPAVGVVDALLRGLEPDAGQAATEHFVDYTTGQTVGAP